MSSVEILIIIATMFGGLALFLTGMDMLSDSLTSLADGTLKRVIGSITKNRFFAFIFGTLVTAVVQSASAITVLSVGLVNSGIIELGKAVGLIIGANLGTTATAWLLSLNAIDGESLIMMLIKPSTFSPFLAIIGVAIRMFSKSEKKKTVGSVLLGFAIMMIGMNLMSQAVAPLRDVPVIKNTLVSFSNPILGFLFACAVTMLIQSSDAVVGIVLAFALAMGMTFGTAIPLVCGAQVGTCITALLSSLGTSNNGKRTALMNLYYNLLKTLPFMVIFYGLNSIIGFPLLGMDVGGVGIPVFHTALNLLGCIIWLPLSNVIVSLANRTIPLSEKEKQEQLNTLTILDRNLLGSPAIAMQQVDKAVILLSGVVGDAFVAVKGTIGDPEKAEEAEILLERSERFNDQINGYLRQIAERDIDRESRAYLHLLAQANTAFGRMGKVTERLLGLTRRAAASGSVSNEEERREMDIIADSIYDILQLTIRGYTARTQTISQTIRYFREEILELGAVAKRRYIRRIHEEGRERNLDDLYTEIIYCQEQLIDYCDMVADSMIRYEADTGGIAEPAAGTDEKIRSQIHMLFVDKYEALGIDPDEN